MPLGDLAVHVQVIIVGRAAETGEIEAGVIPGTVCMTLLKSVLTDHPFIIEVKSQPSLLA